MKTARELELEKDFARYSNRVGLLTNERYRNDIDISDKMDLERVISEATTILDDVTTELYSIKSPRVKIHTSRKESTKVAKYKITYTYSIEKNTDDFTFEEVLTELIPLCDRDLSAMLRKKLNEIQGVKNDNA